ncbi:MAG: GFA family protein [Pseudomonadota bacterium]|nr:GFA family protein [Pseudomonadota bacterium]
MIEAKGGCHCGAVRFAARLPDPPVPALDCNCSICTMTGFRHLIVVHQDFALVSGAEALTSYRFGTGAAEHLFCSACGVKSFYQPRSHPDAWSVNAHCLDEALDLVVDQFDGRDWDRAKAALDAG